MSQDIFSLQNKIALITGASRGIGKGIAHVFGDAGAQLAVVALNAERLAHTANELRAQNVTVLDFACDVSDAAQVQRAVEAVIAHFGRIDILVNNAGILQAGHVTDFSASDWEKTLAVNLNSAFYFVRAVAPTMMQQNYGRIINIASISAFTGGVAGSVQYAASKGGMISMVKTLSRDLAPHNITVNAIAPGQIETDMGVLTGERRQRVLDMIPLKRLGTPQDIAYATLFLASDAASYITGITLDVNGGLLKR